MHQDGILLCIMTLIHDAKFIFYDKAKATIFLCIYQDPPKTAEKVKSFDDNIYENGVVALYISGARVNFPLFVSDLKIKNYLPYNDFISQPAINNMKLIPWVSAIRVNGMLQLV
jgi:hypothetical protein